MGPKVNTRVTATFWTVDPMTHIVFSPTVCATSWYDKAPWKRARGA